LAIAFEVGAAASLASLIALKKMNKGLVWMLFFLLTAMQAMGNTYYAYVNLDNFTAWSELFGIVEEELIFQKRVLSIVSGAILPIVALGFIKSLVDYIKPEEEVVAQAEEKEVEENKTPEVKPEPVQSTEEKTEKVVLDELITEPLISEIPQEELLIDAGGSLYPVEEEITNNQESEEIEKIETEHNGRVVIEEKRVLPRSVETPTAALNPTRL
jgi:hypothetical protein